MCFGQTCVITIENVCTTHQYRQWEESMGEPVGGWGVRLGGCSWMA